MPTKDDKGDQLIAILVTIMIIVAILATMTLLQGFIQAISTIVTGIPLIIPISFSGRKKEQ